MSKNHPDTLCYNGLTENIPLAGCPNVSAFGVRMRRHMQPNLEHRFCKIEPKQERIDMSRKRKTYTPEFKTKVVLELLG
jgi:hypothetical protein